MDIDGERWRCFAQCDFKGMEKQKKKTHVIQLLYITGKDNEASVKVWYFTAND